MKLSDVYRAAGLEVPEPLQLAEALVAWAIAMRAFCNRGTLHT